MGFYGCGLVDGCLRVSESHVALSQAGHVSIKWRCMLEHFAVSRLHLDGPQAPVFRRLVYSNS